MNSVRRRRLSRHCPSRVDRECPYPSGLFCHRYGTDDYPGSLLPGKVPDRLIGTTPQSRNELLASAFLRYRLCEERGTGFEKVVSAAELFGLPPVSFVPAENAFQVVLHSPRKLAEMSQSERIEACYQHSVLKMCLERRPNKHKFA
jgi:predicted HTH transcriptional regulator